MGKGNHFNKWYWENWISSCKRMKLDPYFIPYMKMNSKWIKDLKVCAKIIKLLEENIGGNLHDKTLKRIYSKELKARI